MRNSERKKNLSRHKGTTMKRLLIILTVFFICAGLVVVAQITNPMTRRVLEAGDFSPIGAWDFGGGTIKIEGGACPPIATGCDAGDGSEERRIFVCTSGETGAYVCSDDSSGWEALAGGGGSGDVTAVGPGCASGLCFTDGKATTGTEFIIWEGTGVDANQIVLSFPANPSAVNTITFAELTGTVVLDTATQTLTNKTLTSPTYTTGQVLGTCDGTNVGQVKWAASTAGAGQVPYFCSGVGLGWIEMLENATGGLSYIHGGIDMETANSIFIQGVDIQSHGHTGTGWVRVDIDDLANQGSWDTPVTKATADLTIAAGIDVNFETGGGDGYPRLGRNNTPVAADCNADDEAGRLYLNTTLDTPRGEVIFCPGDFSGWKMIDDGFDETASFSPVGTFDFDAAGSLKVDRGSCPPPAALCDATDGSEEGAIYVCTSGTPADGFYMCSNDSDLSMHRAVVDDGGADCSLNGDCRTTGGGFHITSTGAEVGFLIDNSASANDGFFRSTVSTTPETIDLVHRDATGNFDVNFTSASDRTFKFDNTGAGDVVVDVVNDLTAEQAHELRSGRRFTLSPQERVGHAIGKLPMIAVRIDDLNSSDYLFAFLKAKQYNIPIGLSAKSDGIDTRVTTAQLQEMRDSGLVEFYNHAATQNDLTDGDTDAQVRDEIDNSQAALNTALGFVPDYFTYPGDNWNNKQVGMAQGYFRGALTGADTLLKTDRFNKFHIPSVFIDDDNTGTQLDKAKEIVDLIVKNRNQNFAVIFGSHKMSAEQAPPGSGDCTPEPCTAEEVFDGLLSYIAGLRDDGLVDAVFVSEIVSYFDRPEQQNNLQNANFLPQSGVFANPPNWFPWPDEDLVGSETWDYDDLEKVTATHTNSGVGFGSSWAQRVTGLIPGARYHAGVMANITTNCEATYGPSFSVAERDDSADTIGGGFTLEPATPIIGTYFLDDYFVPRNNFVYFSLNVRGDNCVVDFRNPFIYLDRMGTGDVPNKSFTPIDIWERNPGRFKIQDVLNVAASTTADIDIDIMNGEGRVFTGSGSEEDGYVSYSSHFRITHISIPTCTSTDWDLEFRDANAGTEIYKRFVGFNTTEWETYDSFTVRDSDWVVDGTDAQLASNDIHLRVINNDSSNSVACTIVIEGEMIGHVSSTAGDVGDDGGIIHFVQKASDRQWTPALDFKEIAGDLGTPTDSDCWYNTTTDKITCRQGAANVELGEALDFTAAADLDAAGEVANDSHTHDIDNLTGQGTWSTAATKDTADLTVSGVEVDFENGAAEGYPKLAESTTPPAADCNDAAESGRLYFDTDGDTDGEVMICRGVAGWKAIDDDGGAGGFASFDIDGDNNSPQTITDGQEALFVGGVGIDTTAGVTDQISFAFDATEILGTTTWGGGAGQAFVWNVGVTDPTFTFASDSLVITNVATLTVPTDSWQDSEVANAQTIDLNAASLFPRTDTATNARGEFRVPTATDGFFWFTGAEHQAVDLDTVQTITGAKTFNSDSFTVTAGNWTNAAHNHSTDNGGTLAAGVFTAQSIDGDDIATTLAGRSLTMDTAATPDEIDADIELYEKTKCMLIETPDDADNLLFFRAERAITLTGIDCLVNAATSAQATVQECNADGGSCVNSEPLVTCGTTNSTETGGFTDAAIDAGDWTRIDVGTISGTPGHLNICVTFTVDD
jgi:hypothetical protein